MPPRVTIVVDVNKMTAPFMDSSPATSSASELPLPSAALDVLRVLARNVAAGLPRASVGLGGVDLVIHCVRASGTAYHLHEGLAAGLLAALRVEGLLREHDESAVTVSLKGAPCEAEGGAQGLSVVFASGDSDTVAL